MDLKIKGMKMAVLNRELIEYLERNYPDDPIAKIMISGFKDDIFQNLHLVNTSKECFATDLDLIEARRDRGIIALSEGKEEGYPLKRYGLQRRIFPSMADKLNVPFYFYQYSLDLEHLKITKVIVWEIGIEGDKGKREMTGDEYWKFIEGL